MIVHGYAGPVVVKLAGIAGGIRLYDEEIAKAVAAGYRVVAADISGDRWDDLAGRRIDWDLYAAEVAEAIERASAERAIVWGTSFGCLIALAAAARHPDRIRGLLLCHPPDPLRRPRLHRALLALTERGPSPDLVARVIFSAAFVGMTSWEAISPQLWVRLPALLRASVEAATPPATVRRKLELLFREDPGLPKAEASIPVEIISGAWDLVAPLSGARRLVTRMPGARLQVLKMAGHSGAYSQPKAHREAVLAALKRLTND
jgi:pimeloyl-ACP methyl ester carboxylesterase